MKGVAAILAIVSLVFCFVLLKTVQDEDASLKQLNERIKSLEAREDPVNKLRKDLSELDQKLSQLQDSLNPEGRTQTIIPVNGSTQPMQPAIEIGGIRLRLEMVLPKDCAPHPPGQVVGVCIQSFSDIAKDNLTSVVVLVSSDLNSPDEETLMRKEVFLTDELDDRLAIKDLAIFQAKDNSGKTNGSSLSLFFEKGVNPNAREFQLNLPLANQIYSVHFRLIPQVDAQPTGLSLVH